VYDAVHALIREQFHFGPVTKHIAPQTFWIRVARVSRAAAVVHLRPLKLLGKSVGAREKPFSSEMVSGNRQYVSRFPSTDR
jgi:hypothetical protein